MFYVLPVNGNEEVFAAVFLSRGEPEEDLSGEFLGDLGDPRLNEF